jgi:hypothetical protein
MKRFVLILVLCVVAVSTSFAAGFYVTPSLSADLGSSNYFRGFNLGGQAMYDLGGIALGVEVKADYDTWFGVFNMPLMLIVGFGRDFWIGAGYTVALGTMDIGGYDWQFGGFPNTYALGVNVFRLPLPFAELVVQSELSYTVNSAVDSAEFGGLDILVAILYGLKATAGVGLEFKI